MCCATVDIHCITQLAVNLFHVLFIDPVTPVIIINLIMKTIHKIKPADKIKLNSPLGNVNVPPQAS